MNAKKTLSEKHPKIAKATKLVLVSGGVLNIGLLLQFQLKSDAKAEYDRLYHEQNRLWSSQNDLRKEIKIDLNESLEKIEKKIDKRLDRFESKLDFYNRR